MLIYLGVSTGFVLLFTYLFCMRPFILGMAGTFFAFILVGELKK